jgi:hypothetical protein
MIRQGYYLFTSITPVKRLIQNLRFHVEFVDRVTGIRSCVIRAPVGSQEIFVLILLRVFLCPQQQHVLAQVSQLHNCLQQSTDLF